jgi:hypothetical protein
MFAASRVVVIRASNCRWQDPIDYIRPVEADHHGTYNDIPAC